NRITEVEDLKGFHTGGYAFDPEMSQDNTLVFSRDYPED
ncbi:MAG: peroxide stress protein YaaA, partial [Marivivens sp.]|nr:peroxide stress protein YaaA [Marivivens sp.]